MESWNDGVMPFGKHRGKRLGTVPTHYLRWLLSGCDRLDGQLRERVKEELGRRGGRYLDAWTVLADLEEAVIIRVCEDDDIDHEVAARLGDHLLLGFEEVRERFGIGDGAQLMVGPARVDPETEPSRN